MVLANVGSRLDPCEPMMIKESMVQMCMNQITLSTAAIDTEQTHMETTEVVSSTKQ